MLILFQYYKKIVFHTIFIISFIFCNEKYISNWGPYSIDNQSLNITNDEIIPIINEHINYINSLFGEVQKVSFKIIIKKDNMKYNNTFNWSLGITQGNKIIIKDPSISHITKARFYQVLQHELNHIYLNRIALNSDIPRWFKEGFCMEYANESSLRNKLILANEIKNKEIFDIKYINQFFFSNSKKQFNFAYAYSEILVNRLLDTYGEQTVQDILQHIRKGTPFDKAFYLSTLITVEDYAEDIYEYIYLKYRWMNLIKFPNFLLIFAPLLVIIGFIGKNIRNKKIIRIWEIEEELEENKISED